jgi:hypothetical protein
MMLDQETGKDSLAQALALLFREPNETADPSVKSVHVVLHNTHYCHYGNIEQ